MLLGSLLAVLLLCFFRVLIVSNAGGSANINGILYQILGTLDQAMNLRLEAMVTNRDEILQARLIIEPSGGGGDLQIHSPRGRRIQQWKAKSKGGTWSLAKVVEDVLPDLYLAVADDASNANERYEFISEGTIGDWQHTYEFFRSLPNLPSPSEVPEALAKAPKRHMVGRRKLSDHGLFQHILKLIRKREEIGREPSELTVKKLWHLLQRFEIPAPVKQEQLLTRINDFLYQYVEFTEDVDSKRRELCGILTELAAKGSCTISAESLLKNANIPLYSFREWKRLQHRLRNRLDEQLKKEQYDPSLDVRPSPAFQDAVTIISGESGQGKTWRLASAALVASQDDSLVVWVPSSRGSLDVATYVARELWNYGLEHDKHLDLDRIADRRQQSNPDIRNPWAIVCVDDVRSKDEALAILRLDWRKWGISLLITTSPEIATTIESKTKHMVAPVRDFNFSELRDYLERRGRSWVQIAHDIRELIRRPVLAKTYADIAANEPGFNPRTEYDLLEAAWKQISDPTDIGLMRTLAGTFQGDPPIYPWPTELILKHGGTSEAVKRLIRQGWLRDVGDGNVAVWHNRFLDWALAKFLLNEFNTGKRSIDQLAKNLQQYCGDVPPNRIQLGYVPMDLLWLLLAPDSQSAKRTDLWQLVQALESYGGLGHDDEGLYRNLLASLGERIVPVLIARTKHSGEEEGNGIPMRVAEALRLIGRHHHDAVCELTKSCLADEHVAMSELGLRLAMAFPKSADPEQIWQIHRSQILLEKPGAESHCRLSLSTKAFNLVAEAHLDWLKQKLVAVDNNETCLSSLVYALSNLGDSGPARRIWVETKALLFEKVPQHERRCLVFCILCFNDRDEYHRLEDWAGSNTNSLGGTSVWALACRDPNRAINVLAKVPIQQLYGITINLGRALLSVPPEAMCVECERLIRERPEHAIHFIAMLSGHGDRLTASLVSLILDQLEAELQIGIQSNEEEKPVSIYHALDLVTGLHGAIILAELRKRRGLTLEDLLCTLACSRISKTSDWADHLFNSSFEILKRIGGSGFTRLINSMLSAEHWQLRMQGCEAAMIRPDKDTCTLLRTACLSDKYYDSNPTQDHIVQQRAIDSLAALCENGSLVKGVLKLGSKISPYVTELRKDKPFISDDDLHPAIDLLDKPESDLYPNAIITIGISGRVEYQERIETILRGVDCKSRVAQACLLALHDLASNCDRIQERLIEQYRSGHHKFLVLKFFNKCNVPSDSYLRLIQGINTLDDIDSRIVRFLAKDAKIRPYIEAPVRQLVDRDGWLMFDAVDLLDPESDRDRNRLWELSLQSDSGIHIVGSKAQSIQKLAFSDPDAAFDIGIESLRTDRRDRDSIPRVLMQIAPDRAVIEICKSLGATNDKSMCCAIGRAFREFAKADQVIDPLSELLASPDWKRRRAGAFIAGFLDDEAITNKLQHLAYSDTNLAIYGIAQDAIRMRQKEAEAIKLINSMPEASSSEIWSCIDFIIQLTDPGILTLSSDPLGFLPQLEKQPFVIRKYAVDAINKHLKKVNESISSPMGRWKDE